MTHATTYSVKIMNTELPKLLNEHRNIEPHQYGSESNVNNSKICIDTQANRCLVLEIVTLCFLCGGNSILEQYAG